MLGSTSKTLRQLRHYESPNVLFIDPDGGWPIVWTQARGCAVIDAEGRRYLDLTAAFGVAAAGHANPAVVRAGRQQMGILLHAMGDVHPHPLKAGLARELSRITFERWTTGSGSREHGKVIFGSSGFEAVEAALKTARIATGKSGIIAFRGGYHGLGYGALNGTERSHFRAPFLNQIGGFGQFASFPDQAGYNLLEHQAELENLFAAGDIGAILVEPMQARGGIRIPPPEFLQLLRSLADRHGALLILDEIYTGFGRTGTWFACEHSRVIPDLICLGKALTGGFPMSACVGRAHWMDRWPPSNGESIHTSTFLGHPVGCAMALAQIQELRSKRLPQRAASLGRILESGLTAIAHRYPATIRRVSALGLMAGIELQNADGSPATLLSLEVIKEMLARGFILLPEGAHAEVISLTPPLTLPESDLLKTLSVLDEVLDHKLGLTLGLSKKSKMKRTLP
ncbi:MAG: aspartate aminotransferase family protein [Pedosphaera sp.]|nr:aspartate aminotransferase family protein [Pedosphaera sp.]